MNGKLRTSMAANFIGGIVAALLVFGVIVGALGFASFTAAFQKEYAESTYHMADTAATLVNGDHLNAYLAGQLPEEYEQTKRYLDAYCKKISVTMIYVIQVDTSDYGRFVSIFNPIDNSVGGTAYTEWELGHRRDTTNDEYREKYRALYEQTAPYETVYRTKPTDGQLPHVTTLVPVRDSGGETAAILCMQRPMSELTGVRRAYLREVGIWTVLLAALAAASASLHVRRRYVEPIRRASEEAARFARENVKGEPLGELSPFREIAGLARSIDTMETDMVSYIENLTAATAERERLGAELSVAAKIQENSIPNDFPAFPGRTDFDVYAVMDPAKEVGGDFYNSFLGDDDHLAVVIGDVSGKGVPAALFMMVTNILISDRTQMGGTPAEILTYVNENICAHNKADMFVTLWLGILELSTGRMTAANAGHDDAAICRRDGTFELYPTKHSLVVGAMPGVRYRDFTLQLEPGDRLFLYTDGVPEATDAHNEMFTIERMLGALDRNRDGTPQELLRGVRAEVDAFVGEAPQFDDLTMLCVELKERNAGPA